MLAIMPVPSPWQPTRCGPRPIVFYSDIQHVVDFTTVASPPPPDPFSTQSRRKLQGDGIVSAPPPPPSPPPTPPPPPLPPNFYTTCTCSCFVADSDDNSHSWSDIEARSRATYVEESAVFYKALTVLSRGASHDSFSSFWVEGGAYSASATPAAHVRRYVESEAVAADISHLVFGVRSSRPVLGPEIHLRAYMGFRPSWWTASDSTDAFLRLPDSRTDSNHWSGVCTSECMRVYGEEVEIVQVDLSPPYLAGIANGVVDAGATPATCKCFAFTDTTEGSADTTTPSLSAPSDASVLQWLSTGTMEADSALRPLVGIYAVHRRLWKWKWIESLQSSLFYARSLEHNHYLEYTLPPASDHKLSDHNVQTAEECFVECAKAHGGSVRGVALDDEKPGQECNCFDVPLTDPSLDALWRLRRDGETGSNFHPFDVRFCAQVRGGNERSVVYRKSSGEVCRGDPISGMTLEVASLLSAQDVGASTVPFDLRCKALCDAEPLCEVAHSTVSTFEDQSLATKRPPPPSPPGSPPPPGVPPLPPFLPPLPRSR